jgi:hypothetical protein
VLFVLLFLFPQLFLVLAELAQAFSFFVGESLVLFLHFRALFDTDEVAVFLRCEVLLFVLFEVDQSAQGDFAMGVGVCCCLQVAVDEDVVIGLVHEYLCLSEDEDGEEGEGHEEILCAELVLEVFEVPDVSEEVEGLSDLVIAGAVAVVLGEDFF